MPKIHELLAAQRCISFEFFPPKTDEAVLALQKTLVELEPLNPAFVSVTYGAGGSTRERTRDIVVGILRDTSMTPMAHLTCVGHSREELIDIIDGYNSAGVENILALAGDPLVDGEDGGHGMSFHYAHELVSLIRERGSSSIGVAAHPEGHPRSASLADDRRYLSEKLALADFGVTQFFFDADDYLRMVDDLSRLGVNKPIVPGIMPVTNLGQIERFAQLSGAAFPGSLAERLRGVADQPDEVRRIGVEVATELCQKLLDSGAPGLHFYTLNRSTATREIYANLIGINPVN